MSRRNATLTPPMDQVSADRLRNLLLYALLFHLFASQAVSLFSSTSESDASVISDAGNLYNQLALPAAFLAACSLIYAYRVPVRILSAKITPMAPLLLTMALSALWSDYPELTIRRASHELVEVITLAMLATCFSNAKVILGILFRAFLILGCLDLLSSVVFPSSSTAIGFAGIHGHKNLAGQFFFVALPVYLLGTFYKEVSGNRLLGLFSLVTGIAMLAATQSKTSVGATAFGASLVLLTRALSRRNPAFRVSVFLFLLLGLLCATAAIIILGPDDLLETLIGDPTLTGRDQIWRYAVGKFEGAPLLGAGYGAIWQIGPQIMAALKGLGLFFVFNEAHNGYLEIAAQLGIFGIVCLSMFLITTLLNALSYWATIERNTLYGIGAFTIYIFWGLVISNITESLYFQAGIGESGILIFLAAFVANANRPLMATSNANPVPRPPRQLRLDHKANLKGTAPQG